MSDDNHPKNYLVTQDIGEKISSLRRLGIRTPGSNDPFINDIQSQLVSALQEALPNHVTVKAIPMKDLADDILGAAYESNRTSRNLIISTCAEIAEPMKGVTLEINRLVDIEGRILGIGPRPGNPSLHEQVAAIKHQADGGGVTIVEDGIFSGSTLQFAVKLFTDNDVRVDEIVSGFTFPDAVPVIQDLTASGVKVNCIQEFDDLWDWVPDHDFVPGVPNCGRVVGASVGRGILPIYSHEGASYSIPYVMPLGPMSSWASIPEDKAAQLSKTCFQLAKLIYSQLERLNGGDISIRSLLGPQQPISVPIRQGSQDLPRVGNRSMRQLLTELEQESAFELYRN